MPTDGRVCYVIIVDSASKNKSMFRTIQPLIFSLFFLCAIGFWQKNTLHEVVHESSPEGGRSSFQPQLSTLANAPTLGFRNVAANTVFIQFLQYFGDEEARRKTGYSISPEYLSTSIHRDPYFKPFYVFLSGSTTTFAGKPQKTIDIIKSGLSQFGNERPSDSYYIWRYKAVDELLFLGDSKAAQESFSMAAEWAIESDDPDSNQMATLSRRTADFLSDNPDSRIAQIDAWSSMLSTAIDRNTRVRAIKKIEELGGSVVVAENGSLEIRYEKANESESSDNPGI